MSPFAKQASVVRPTRRARRSLARGRSSDDLGSEAESSCSPSPLPSPPPPKKAKLKLYVGPSPDPSAAKGVENGGDEAGPGRPAAGSGRPARRGCEQGQQERASDTDGQQTRANRQRGLDGVDGGIAEQQQQRRGGVPAVVIAGRTGAAERRTGAPRLVQRGWKRHGLGRVLRIGI